MYFYVQFMVKASIDKSVEGHLQKGKMLFE